MKFPFLPSCLLLILISLFLQGCSKDSRASEQYQQAALQAKTLYDREQYKEAIDSMKRLPLYAGDSMPTFAEMYNLGNAYYRNEELGWAILCYERALRINPRSKVAQHNLALARNKTIDRIEYKRPLTEEFWHRFCYGLPLQGIYFLSLLFSLLLVSGVLLYLFGVRRLHRQWGFYSALVSLIVLLITLAMIHQWKSDFHSEREAIVVVGQSTIKSEPKASALTLFKVNEGTKLIRAASSEGNSGAEWILVSLPDGKKGWIAFTDIQGVYPFSNLN